MSREVSTLPAGQKMTTAEVLTLVRRRARRIRQLLTSSPRSSNLYPARLK